MRRILFSLLAAMVMAVPGVRADLPVLGKAPAWKLKDIQGHEVTSADFKGKVVVVDFWATWCPPCRAEIPGYIALQKKYADKGLVIIGISVDENGAAAVVPFAKAKGINYKMLLFNDDVVAAFGGIEGIPTTFLIDRDGNIRDKKVGMAEEADYEKRVLELLK
ncbi:MAG TPA: TlpA disulfide reductase family protein [Rariglobus sp.]|jgi:thiol-disulfide isomerase/thioredoxin|nr:TlpA disulfide reductase family protein [Rariglobus sp.]